MRSHPSHRAVVTTAAVIAGGLLTAVPATAHNAAHFVLPNGACHEVGSFSDAPLVGRDRTQLDLIPDTPNPPFDEYGTSFAAFQGQTPLLPGPCPA